MGGCVVSSSHDVRAVSYGPAAEEETLRRADGSEATPHGDKLPSPIAPPRYPVDVPEGYAAAEGYPAAAPVDEKKPSMLAKSGHSMRGAPALNGVNQTPRSPIMQEYGVKTGDVDLAELVASLRSQVADLQKKLEAERSTVTRLQAELAQAKVMGAGPERQKITEKDWVQGNSIGTGAHGSVFVSLNTKTGELMATKQITLTEASGQGQADQELVLSFKREVNVLLKLSHPNVVRYIHHQKVGTILTIFQEYVSGGSLESLLSQFGPFHESVICRYAQQMFQGLAYLHSQDIIHRDVKGGNLLVSTTGIVKIADFGTAKMLKKGTDSLQGPFAPHGSPFWLAPEVLKGVLVSKASDLWSAGCVIIEMATGAPPWPEFANRPVTGIIWSISSANRPPAFPSTLSGLSLDLLSVCLALKPEDRQPVSQILQHLWFTSSDKKPSQPNLSNSGIKRHPSSRDGEGQGEENHEGQPAKPGMNQSSTFRKSSVLAKLRAPSITPITRTPSMMSFTSSVSTLQQTQFKYTLAAAGAGESLAISRVKAGTPFIFADASVRQSEGLMSGSHTYDEEDEDGEGEEEVSISIHTIDLALRWLSQIKEVLPLEEYLKKAEDYDEYGAYVGECTEDLEEESNLERMMTQIFGDHGTVESGYCATQKGSDEGEQDWEEREAAAALPLPSARGFEAMMARFASTALDVTESV
eukprot:EG_transcript_2660